MENVMGISSFTQPFVHSDIIAGLRKWQHCHKEVGQWWEKSQSDDMTSFK